MTSNSQESAEIFKQDTKGRVRVRKARREAMLDEYERSGGNAAQFANYVGTKYSTLANWIQKRRKQERLKRSLLKQGEGGGGMEPDKWSLGRSGGGKRRRAKSPREFAADLFYGRGLLSD